MSPRRALATAIAMAVLPSCLFFIGISRYSRHICHELLDQRIIILDKAEDIQNECFETIKSSQWRVFYLLLISSILVNWPVIRWLDDRQWYREWIRIEEKK